MVSNDVEGIPAGGGAYALLLTPKARVISDLEVFNTRRRVSCWRASPETPRRRGSTCSCAPGFARRSSSSRPSVRSSGATPTTLVATRGRRSGRTAWSTGARGERLGRLGGRRGSRRGIPRFGHEFGPDIDAGRGRPRRAGSSSFTKGCYPGQEPIARLHYRGHANRGLRGLAFPGDPAEPGAAIAADDREVGRVTSVADSPRFGRDRPRRPPPRGRRPPEGRRRRASRGRAPPAVCLKGLGAGARAPTSPSRRSRRPCPGSRRRPGAWSATRSPRSSA